MSALKDLTAKPFTPPAQKPSAISTLTASPLSASTTAGPKAITSLTATPFKKPLALAEPFSVGAPNMGVSASTPAAVVSAPNIVTSILDTYRKPSEKTLAAEKTLLPAKPNTGNKTIDKILTPGTNIARTVVKGAVRTFAPGLEPIGEDIGQLLAAPEITKKVENGELPRSALEDLTVLKKTAPQIFGDVSQGVMTAFTPSIFKAGLGAITDKGLAAALGAGTLHGTEAGAVFGVAQALSSGSYDPKELASIIMQSSAAGALLGLVTTGAIKVSPEILARAQQVVKYVQDHPEFKRGFVKSPGLQPGYHTKYLQEREAAKAAAEAEKVNQQESDYPLPSPTSGPVNPKHVDAYIEKFGNELNTDNARELFPHYTADRSRSADVHEPAGDIVKAVYEKFLPEKKGTGNNTVLFTAGGTGAGKTTALRSSGIAAKDYPIVYDTNMNKVDSATQKIEQALKAGYKVDLTYVHNDIKTSLNNAMDRAARMEKEQGSGRTVPLDEHYNTHAGSSETIPLLYEKYANNPNVRFRVLDNEGNARRGSVPVDFLRSKVYDKTNESTTKAELRRQIEDAFAAGRISGKTKAGFLERTSGRSTSENGTKSVARATSGVLEGRGTSEQNSRSNGRGAKEPKVKFSPHLVRRISEEKNPAEIAKTLNKEFPTLSPRVRDTFATHLAGMSRTGDIEGMLTAAKNAIRDLTGGGAEVERRGGSLETNQKRGADSTLDTTPDKSQRTPTTDHPESQETATLPPSIRELLTKQETSTYHDSITKAIKDKESAVLAQQEYDGLWEQADQRVIDRVNELAIMREILEEQVELHPARKLAKYATNGVLPEITGKPTRKHPTTGKSVPNSTYGQRGDDIAGELGFADDAAAQKGLGDYTEMRSRLRDIEQELREMRPRARAAKIIQGMVDEVPVIAQDKAGEINKLGDGDDIRYKYRDISGFMGQARDVYRNFEAFFKDSFPEVKKSILDPFDKSKGAMVDEVKKLGDELSEGIVKKYGFKRGGKESRAIMDWGEREIVSRGERVPGMNMEHTSKDGLVKTFGEEKAEHIIEAEKWFRREYDRLIDEANDVRVKIYPNDPTKLIPKRKDYFRHFKEIGGDFAALRDLIENAAGTHPGIDPTLAGISEFTSPKSKFLSFAKERIGQGSERDAIGGFVDYAPAFSYMKHIDPHIGVFRYLRRILSENAPTPGVTERVTEGGTTVKKQQKGINNFLEYLNDFSNDLAGKTNPMDRYLQKTVPGGRVTMRAIDWINSRVKANQILGNLSSSVAQVFNVPQGIGSAKLYSVPGMQRTLASIFTENEPMSHSAFIKERFAEPIANRFKIDWAEHPIRGSTERAKEFAAWLTQAGDEIGSKFIWNSHYAKGVGQHVADPVKYADDMTRKLVAGRGVGEVPLMQKSKTFQLVAPFQIEVANSWHVMKDMVRAKDFGGIVTFFLAAYLMNEAAKKVRGSKVVFDPIDSLLDGATQASDEITDTGNIGRAIFKFTGRQAGELLSNIPLGQTIAAAIPESWVKGATGLTGAPQDKKEFFGEADPGRFGSSLLAISGLSDPLYKLIPPFGGAQAKRTVEGIQALQKGSVTNAGGKKAFNVTPTPRSVVQAFLFGKNATPEAQKYYEEHDNLFRRTYAQDASRTQTTLDAEAQWADVKKLKDSKGPEAAKQKMLELAKDDPALVQKMLDIAKEEAKGLDGNDRMIKMLGVVNGERAKYIVDQVNGMGSNEEKKAYLKDLAIKKLLSAEVLQQVVLMLNK